MATFFLNDMWVYLNPFLLAVGLYLLLWNAYFLVFNKGIPNIKTAPAIRAEIIKRLKIIAEESNEEKFTIIDLGCGNGHFSKEIATAIPNAHVVGIEIDKISYWKALWLQKRSNLPNLEFCNADFYKTDISETNAVVMFLLGTLMKGIRAKLESDLKEGTYVFSNKFKVGGDWKAMEEVDVDTKWPNQKTFFVYKR